MRQLLHYFLVLVFGLYSSACVTPVVVEGTAMSPALNDGDRLFMSTHVSVSDLKRGDIIEFKYPNDTTKHYIKRIVGLPEETIEVRAGTVIVNGQQIVEEYIDQSLNRSGYNMMTRKIPKNHFFVMGDNRDNSSDSRYWGTVDHALIVGKYYWSYFKTAPNGK